MLFDQIEYKENFQIADKFSNFFVACIISIRDTITYVKYSNEIPVINSEVKFSSITIDKIRAICKGLKNKPDYNKISNKIVLNSWNINKYIFKNTNISREGICEYKKIAKTKFYKEFRPTNTIDTFEKYNCKVKQTFLVVNFLITVGLIHI